MLKEKYYYVYIMTNKWNTTFYTGVTNNLTERVYQHKAKKAKGFTTKYNINKLIYFEISTTPYDAIQREKQIKAGSRLKKIALIKQKNPEWRDLSEELL